MSQSIQHPLSLDRRSECGKPSGRGWTVIDGRYREPKDKGSNMGKQVWKWKGWHVMICC